MLIVPVTLQELQTFIRESAPGNKEFIVTSLEPYRDALHIGSDACERLEFLGDSILSVVVTQYLYERFPVSREGFLTKMRSKIVSSKMLTQIAIQLGLDYHVRDRRSTYDGAKMHLAVDDILEAFLAAISIDMGLDLAKTWFLNVLEHHVDVSALVSWHDSSKQRLTKLNGALTFVETRATRETVSVCVRDARGVVLGTATARTRKEAEEDASRKALTIQHGANCAASLPREAMASRKASRVSFAQ